MKSTLWMRDLLGYRIINDDFLSLVNVFQKANENVIHEWEKELAGAAAATTGHT